MDINNSAGIANRVRLRSIVVATIIFVVLIVATVGLVLLLAVPVWIIGYLIAQREIAALARDASSFKKNYPFRIFGASYGDFRHTFHHQNSLELQVLNAIDAEVRSKTPITGLRDVTITDIDKDLLHPEARTFKVASAPGTSRGSHVTLVTLYAHFGGMQSIKWWVLAGGYVDRDKKFNFIAYAPITIWFWIIPYLGKNYDVIDKLRTVYGATYNSFDIENQVRSLHDVVFNALIAELDANGIDTSDLKVQRMQVMNITISGGQVNMGNVVQGAMNKVMSAAGGSGGAK